MPRRREPGGCARWVQICTNGTLSMFFDIFGGRTPVLRPVLNLYACCYFNDHLLRVLRSARFPTRQPSVVTVGYDMPSQSPATMDGWHRSAIACWPPFHQSECDVSWVRGECPRLVRTGEFAAFYGFCKFAKAVRPIVPTRRTMRRSPPNSAPAGNLSSGPPAPKRGKRGCAARRGTPL